MRVTLKLSSKIESSDDPMYPKKNRSKTQAPVAVPAKKVGKHTPIQKRTKYPKTTHVGSK